MCHPCWGYIKSSKQLVLLDGLLLEVRRAGSLYVKAASLRVTQLKHWVCRETVAGQLGREHGSWELLPGDIFLIGIVGDEVQLRPLGSAATNRLIVPAPGDYEDGEIVGMMIGKRNRSTRTPPVRRCPPQTPHAVRMRTRAAAVGSQRLIAWATARPTRRQPVKIRRTRRFRSCCSELQSVWINASAIPISSYVL
jgi:hypothetical protein